MCGPPGLDCVEAVVVPEEECPELCEGTITELETLSSPRPEEGWDPVLAEYEKYKYQHSDNITLPWGMKGQCCNSRTVLVDGFV